MTAAWGAESNTIPLKDDVPALQRVWDAEVRQFQPAWDGAGCCGASNRESASVCGVWCHSVSSSGCVMQRGGVEIQE